MTRFFCAKTVIIFNVDLFTVLPFFFQMIDFT